MVDFFKRNRALDSHLRSASYRVDDINSFARNLAHTHEVSQTQKKDYSLLIRLQQNNKVLVKAHGEFVDEISKGSTILPSSSEWLIDNYYLIQNQVRQIKRDLSKDFYEHLPRLSKGSLSGHPRIYGLALELIFYTDGRIDEESLETFLTEYQKVAPLTSVELWAMPVILRVSLIEYLAQLTEIGLENLHKRKIARQMAESIVEISAQKKINKQLESWFPSSKKLDPVVIISFLHRLRESDPSATYVIRWVENRVLEEDIKLDEFIRAETSKRAIDRITVGNIVSSLRTLSFLAWADFFEKVSLVEKILQTDPAGLYSKMDFVSRDRYRHVIEELSKYSVYTEQEVARRAIKLAAPYRDERKGHVGYYLISHGLKNLKYDISYSPTLKKSIANNIMENPVSSYLSIIALTTVSLLALFIHFSGSSIPWVMFVILLFILTSPAIHIVNWVVTSLLPPKPPPKLKLKDIPESLRTMVVVPCMIKDAEQIGGLLGHLERRYLANSEENLHFALLSDYADANEKILPEDARLVKTLTTGIENLNKKYARDEKNIFYAFHRERLYNEKENLWMGWERKRGKLMEFNRLLTGSEKTSYTVKTGDMSILKKIRYVITLDADTELPLGTAKKLIGAMAHPLNQPVIDKNKRVIVDGYGIIQPRVDISAPDAAVSLFSRIFTRDSGLDQYTIAVSNVYQDLFGTGIFIGKAIYDVNVIKETIQERFPENTLLSHDLIEGCYARVGLSTDIELLEDFPSSYYTYVQRQHRWVRGDWQIAQWLLPFVPEPHRLVANPLSLSSKWKIFDNLRRSLIQPGVLFLLLLSWFGMVSNPFYWSVVGMLILWIPLMSSLVGVLRVFTKKENLSGYLWVLWNETLKTASQILLVTVFLFHESFQKLDAILRTFYRKFISKKNLLEWTSHSDAEKGQPKFLDDYIKRMWVPVVFSLIIFPAVQILNPGAIYLAAPFVLLWLISPIVSFYISRPIKEKVDHLSFTQRQELRTYTARVWRFFEEFVDEKESHLPPDNYQLVPKEVVAHRTSPTNIGLYLLSVISAYDYGYLGKKDVIERLEKTLDSVTRLRTHKGHLYNWYNTQSLEPIMHYISTVDSGNLAASYICVKQGCLELMDKLGNENLLYGFRDSLANLVSYLEEKQVDTITKDLKDMLNSLDDHFSTGEMLGVEHFEFRLNKISEEISKISGNSDIDYWLKKSTYLYELCLSEENKTREQLNEENKRLYDLSNRLERMASKMDFSFLLDEDRGLFSIGFNLDTHVLDNSYYDLLASEARIASFFAISKKQVEPDHWFKLGRPITRIRDGLGLLSWGGTMFEYLMPSLLMNDYDNTLIAETNKSIVNRQIDYGKSQGVPWGISESGFYAFDFQFNYQYRLFGVPDLGLKTEMVRNLVVAPYATFLALPIVPQQAWNNLKKLGSMGGSARYGFYEAIDFTPSRIPKGNTIGVVQSYMAHHQGMSFLAVNNYLNQNINPQRFHRDSAVASAELLLQERIPSMAVAFETPKEHRLLTKPDKTEEDTSFLRTYRSPHTTLPRMHILSNGRYTTTLSNGGGGYSKWNDLEITRFEEDATLDDKGLFIYIKDLDTNQIWSSAYQPTLKEPKDYEVVYFPNKVRYRRVDSEITTRTEVFVSPDDDVEIRQITITNNSEEVRHIQLTSYAEVVLDTHGAGIAHPAFNKLFVETSFNNHDQTLLFKRRTRSDEQEPKFAFHTVFSNDVGIDIKEYETDRYEFIGRGRSTKDPQALYTELSNTTGTVLDPIMSMRTSFKVTSGESVTVSYITGGSESSSEAMELARKYKNTREIERMSDLSKVHSQIEFQHLGITEEQANMFQKLGSRIIYPDPALQATKEVRMQNVKGQSGLFPHGISGDNKIVLLRVRSKHGLSLVKNLLSAHEFFRMRNFAFDLVILEDGPVGYENELFNQIQVLIESSLSHPYMDKSGGVFLRKTTHLSTEDLVLLNTVAQVIIDSDYGSLADHLGLLSRTEQLHEAPGIVHVGTVPRIKPLQSRRQSKKSSSASELLYANGYGGFSENGNEYTINLNDFNNTPLPWSNVIANQEFGTVVTESGLGYSWAVNSQSNKLTPWSNDPVSDKQGEIIYIKDEETEEVWNPTPLPARERDPYTIKHKPGATSYHHESHGIKQQLEVFVPKNDPVKVMLLTLKNRSRHKRSLSVTFYAEWVLGVQRESTKHFINVSLNRDTEAIFAKNTYNEEFSNRVAFIGCSNSVVWASGNRTRFLGRNGSKEYPQALYEKNKTTVSTDFGPRTDPCGVLQTRISLGPGEEKEVVFVLGQAPTEVDARALVEKYQDIDVVDSSRVNAQTYWEQLLTTVQVKTPDEEMNILLNGWLLYQTLSCRYFARTSFYQAGGAYGFRDQLQDVMALAFSKPEIMREHILRAASHQFVEGDVQHWWHYPSGKGVRTRITDDLLWLPFVVSYYIQVTGDRSILNEEVSFLAMAQLEPDQHEMFGQPQVTGEMASIYEHCKRAIDLSLRFGSHEIPLIGTGDWNDGMNNIGANGQGESIWLGWFLYSVLNSFADICESKGNIELKDTYLKHAENIRRANIENGWDGEWFRRAYFDNGKPVGSKENQECFIDSISQSWAIISGAVDGDKGDTIMESVDKHLVDKDEQMILLLTPPFQNTKPHPGYIQGYPAGIRENGGQYTHGVIWVVQAYTKLKNGDKAIEMYKMLNPINHTKTTEHVNNYKTEPYVMPADVYSNPQHYGRGGWSWYTGSAGWMYRVGIEDILGLKVSGDSFTFEPCIPHKWDGFQMTYRYKSTLYEVTVENPDGVSTGVKEIKLDDKSVSDKKINFVDDGETHTITVVLGN